MKARRPVSLLGFVALLSTLLLGSCVDGPVAGPATDERPHVLHLVPQLSYAVAPGAPALSAAQEHALSQAFDRVDRFRLIVKDVSCTEVLLDVIFEVTPGEDVYDLSVELPGITPGEPVCVTIIAMQGETVLFESPPLTVATTDTQTATPPPPFDVPLTYEGPGADAVGVEIQSTGAVLPPGGSLTFEAEVLGSDGSVLADVPLGWTVASPAVASVTDAGTVTGGGGGRTLVTVTTPTGLSASVWVYVFGGEMTFIQGGMVMTAPVVGGTAQVIAGTGGAHGPVPTGSGVMYGEGGMVFISGVAIMSGSWPAPSPDGTKIAADGGGVVLLANADGSGESEGPAGSQPAWASATSLYVSGGSIELVDVVSGSRSLVIAGAASFPTVTAEGRLAYLDGGGQVFIQGSGPVAGVVTGSRPAIQGGWVLYAGGGGLMVAPVDGASPPMALGISGTDPAWGSASGGFTPPSPPPPVEITGLDPETPVPGQEALILGSGFDPIIASNTRVFFPTEGGEVEVEVLEITATSIRVVVPRGVAAGEIRVATLTSEATFPYTPVFGSVAVTAVTPWGAPVAGLGVVLTQGGAEASSGVTDASGSLFLDGILPGDYTAAYAAPAGFAITSAPPTALTVTTDVLSVEVEATPEVRRITISPAVPEVEVGSSVEVMLQPLDINGDVIPLIDQVTWAGSSALLNASGSTLTGTITGVSPSTTPGDALFRVFVNGTGADFFATVTSFIEGTFTLGAAVTAPGEAEGGPAAAPEPLRIIEVELRRGSTLLMRTESDADGRYRFPGLFAGTYTVKPLPRNYKGFLPSSADVTLGGSNPTGRADFEVLKVVNLPGLGQNILVFNDQNTFDNTSALNPDNRTFYRNLTKLAGGSRAAGTVVWIDVGRNSVSAGGLGSTAEGEFSGEGLTTTPVSTSSGTLTSIPANVRVFFLWLPTVAFTTAEINTLKAFVAEGGVLIYNGEYFGFYGSAGRDTENQFLSDMGSGLQMQPDQHTSGYTLLPASSLGTHPATAGMNSLTIAASASLLPLSSATPIFFDPSGTHLLGAATPVSVTPLPLGGPAPAPRLIAPEILSDDPTGIRPAPRGGKGGNRR